MKITEPTITSKDNPRLKLARAVRDGRAPGLIFIEGARLISELSRSALKPKIILVSEELAERSDDLVPELRRNSNAEVTCVAERIFDSIADTDHSQGIVALADRPASRPLTDLTVEASLTVYLSQVNNPSNLGALIRTAEAAGAKALLISPGSADPFSPKALRASMGSAFRLPIFSDIDIESAADFARRMGIRILAADVKANKSYTEADWQRPVMLVFGSEAHGLNERELGLVDEMVLIPMENGVESLNLAVSAGVLLFEAKRQRRLR